MIQIIVNETTLDIQVFPPSMDIQIFPPSMIDVVTSIPLIRHGNEAHVEPLAEVDMDNVEIIDGGIL